MTRAASFSPWHANPLPQKAGFIRYERGRMEITDRPGLEAAACECYGIARRAYDRLLGPPTGTKRPSWR